MATSQHQFSTAAFDHVFDACPEAFAAVDRDFVVTHWNAAAEALTGFSRDDAVGRILPHLTDAQLADLKAAMPRFDQWKDEVPIVLPRRHADGHTIQVCVTAYTRLTDDNGEFAGYGSFFRDVRVTDPRTHSRNVYSRAMAESVRRDDVLDALTRALTDLLPGQAGYLLVRHPDGWRGEFAVADHQEAAESIGAPHPDELDHVLTGRRPHMVRLVIKGHDTDTLVVPAGPEQSGMVLALTGADIADASRASIELAEALAAESGAALARVDALDELEGKVEILEAIAGVARATGLRSEAMINHVAAHAAKALSCERAAVYLWNEDRSELELAAFHSSDREWAPGDEIHAAGRKAAAEMFATVEPFLTQDTRTCP